MITWYRRSKYADKDATPDQLNWGTDIESCKESEAEWFQLDCFLWGDYCGHGVLARANTETLVGRFAIIEDKYFWRDQGSFGAHYVWFSVKVWKGERCEELKEFLERLEEYPCADEGDLSELEMQEENQAWEDGGPRELRRELVKLAPHHDELFDRIPDDKLNTLWYKLAEEYLGGESCIHEQGGAYLPFYQCFKRASWPTVRALILDTLRGY